jgi:hypothetical protein
MRLSILVGVALLLASCATINEVSQESTREETVRLTPSGDLALFAGGYGDDSDFSFHIYYPIDATDLSTPTQVSWTVNF